MFIRAYNFKMNRIMRSFIFHKNKSIYSNKYKIFRWFTGHSLPPTFTRLKFAVKISSY